MSIPKPYLPKLKDVSLDNALSLPPQQGKWDERGGLRRLPALADAIDVPPGSQDVHSVPDPWARVILFARALYDPGHALHAKIRGEWRGLLAMLGLRARLGMVGLSAHGVTLANVTRPDYFSSVLARMLPSQEDVLSADDSWASFYILRYSPVGSSARPQAFGITSPSTLVATGAFYPNALTPLEVPWFGRDPQTGQDILRDPVDVLSAKERHALAEWIRYVQFTLGDTGTFRNGDMLKCLDSFATALDPGVRTFDNAAGAQLVIAGPDQGLGMHAGLSYLLDRPHKPEERDLSHVLIETNVPGLKRRYALIDPSVAQTLREDPKEIVVFKSITLAGVKQRLPESLSSTSGALDRDRFDMDWCTPEFFFQTYLVYENTSTQAGSANSNPFPGCRPATTVGAPDPRRILFPLSEAVTDLFTADYLAQNFSIEWKNTGEAVCRLRLNLKSVSLEPGKETASLSRGFVISKIYQPSQMMSLSTLPAVVVWPNVRILQGEKNAWTRYYIFESWQGMKKTDDFNVAPLKRVDSVHRTIGKVDVFQFHVTSSFPDFLTCKLSPREVDGYEVQPTALLLLRAPDTITVASNKPAALGIDFGTTGTSIFWALDKKEAQPQQMKFRDWSLRVTDYDQNALPNLTRELFLPAQEWSTGRLLSVYQTFADPAPREVLDGHVLFSNDTNPGRFISGNQSGVRANLKWGKEARQNEAADGFLTQLCMQALVELLSEQCDAVDFRYSYPTAFSVEQIATFNGIWGRVIKRLRSATTIQLTNNTDEKENREAVAATRYFANSGLGLSLSRGALTIDIGGGTTDIAVWSKDRESNHPALMAHLSVMLAGQDIFLNAIRKKPEALKILDASIPVPPMEARGNTEAYYAQIDALISARGNELLDGLPGNEQALRGLLSVMATGLCGIGFYAGLLTGRLAQVGAFIPEQRLPVFVGGNGSRLLEWCASKYFVPRMPFYKKLAASILAGCQVGQPGLSVSVEISLSEEPKKEVAYGLVAYGLGSEPDDLDINEGYTDPMAGESFLVRGGSSGTWLSTPAAASLRANTVTVDPGLPEFRKFVQAAGVTVSEEAFSSIADLINDRLTRMASEAKSLQGADADERTLDPLRKEPIFIMAVKELLNMQVSDWVKDA